MTEAEYFLATLPETPVPAETPEAPNSWDPAGRNVPAAKLDWTECLPFRQVRGVDVSQDPYARPERRAKPLDS
jgi:hypothetical protein